MENSKLAELLEQMAANIRENAPKFKMSEYDLDMKMAQVAEKLESKLTYDIREWVDYDSAEFEINHERKIILSDIQINGEFIVEGAIDMFRTFLIEMGYVE